MKNLSKAFDKKFSLFDGGQNIIKPGTYSSWIKSFIHQREKELLKEIQDIAWVHKDEVDLKGKELTENIGWNEKSMDMVDWIEIKIKELSNE